MAEHLLDALSRTKLDDRPPHYSARRRSNAGDVRFFLETPEPDELERKAIHYLDTVLQAEDIALVEEGSEGMSTPAFTQGRIVNDPQGSGKSEHALHHFQGLVLEAYDRASRVER